MGRNLLSESKSWCATWRQDVSSWLPGSWCPVPILACGWWVGDDITHHKPFCLECRLQLGLWKAGRIKNWGKPISHCWCCCSEAHYNPSDFNINFAIDLLYLTCSFAFIHFPNKAVVWFWQRVEKKSLIMDPVSSVLWILKALWIVLSETIIYFLSIWRKKNWDAPENFNIGLWTNVYM